MLKTSLFVFLSIVGITISAVISFVYFTCEQIRKKKQTQRQHCATILEHVKGLNLPIDVTFTLEDMIEGDRPYDETYVDEIYRQVIEIYKGYPH